MSFGARVSSARGLLALVVSCTLLAAGCTAGSSRSSSSDPAGTTTASPAPAPTIAVLPAGAAAGVLPTERVTVEAAGGQLRSVSVADASGAALAGDISTDATTWNSTGALAYSTSYTVQATAESEDGQQTVQRSTFSTIAPTTLVFPSIGPLDGTTVGIGMPVRVYLDAPATDRAEVQRHPTVTATPQQEGAWSWLSDSEVHWRPKVYWQAGTQVTVDVNLFGVDIGEGAWGKENRQISFSVGDAHRSVANALTHQMQVFDGATLVKTIPVSMGRAEGGFQTRGGPHVVIDKNREKTMDSTTYGLALDAGGYVTEVEYATRISNNGEFVHSAPWSLADQGVRNVSHGCINASPENAAWFFEFSQIGDIVEVVGSPQNLGPADGDIYDWAISWEQWLAGSALP
ncbi:MAG: L,D-transpeptidase [Geodermatophilaceae bacterium]|nr:L,D-transpeptidase [Geodermatophilaceae bacterium]